MFFVKDTPKGVVVIDHNNVTVCTILPQNDGVHFLRGLIHDHNKLPEVLKVLQQTEYWLDNFSNSKDKNTVYYTTTAPVLLQKVKQTIQLLG